MHSLPDGCVHVYGSVPWDALQRQAAAPLKDGKHCFPEPLWGPKRGVLLLNMMKHWNHVIYSNLKLYYIILCYIILYYNMIYYIILYYIILYCIVLYYIIFYMQFLQLQTVFKRLCRLPRAAQAVGSWSWTHRQAAKWWIIASTPSVSRSKSRFLERKSLKRS